TARGRRGLALIVFMAGLAGCSAPESQSQVNLGDVVANVDLRQTLVDERTAATLGTPPEGPAQATEHQRLIVPPGAREAVVQARQAMQQKQWQRLDSLIPKADRDPVLGCYARYWSLRPRMQDPAQPVPEREIIGCF